MCQMKAYIYELCRHRGAAVPAEARACGSTARCLTRANPYNLDFVLEEQPGFCPLCMLRGTPTSYKTLRVGDMLDKAAPSITSPPVLEPTVVRARTFGRPSPRPIPPPSSVPAWRVEKKSKLKTTPVMRRPRRHATHVTPYSSAIRPYARVTIESPIRHMGMNMDVMDTPTPIRMPRSMPHTPSSDLGTPTRGVKRPPPEPSSGNGMLAPPTAKRTRHSVSTPGPSSACDFRRTRSMCRGNA